MNTSFGSKAIKFFRNLQPEFELPDDVSFLLPYKTKEVRKLIQLFFEKYYSDSGKRIFIWGINPGRLGAGTTGIAFTDPVRLENNCGIMNGFNKKPELSSTFIYNVIESYGGTDLFYRNFFLTAVCPVGFIFRGKNINYYDDTKLISASRKFIIESVKKQVKFGYQKDMAICLGEGKNYKYFQMLNDELKLFKEIVPLAHPRFIMQYKRKEVNDYLKKYVSVLVKLSEKKRDST